MLFLNQFLMFIESRDGRNPKANDSNPNPNHASLQWIRILIQILVQRIRIRIRKSNVNMRVCNTVQSTLVCALDVSHCLYNCTL